MPVIAKPPAVKRTMVLYRKYSDLMIDDIYEAYIESDKTTDPHQAIALKNELEHRKAQGEVSAKGYDLETHEIVRDLKSGQPMTHEELPVVFSGRAGDYFRIWIVNLCLSLLTLGIFSAWAKVRKKRYFYSHFTIAGTPFQYLGQPIPILKGRLVAVAGFGAYYIASHFIPAMLPFVLGIGLVAAPLVLVRSAAFTARYSAYRNMTFQLDAGYMDAFKVLYAWGILPAFALGIIFQGFGHAWFTVITSLVFSVSFPWLICRIKKFIVTGTEFGQKKGVFSAKGFQFFTIYFGAGLIFSAVMLPIGFLAGTVLGFSQNMSWFSYVVASTSYIGYLFAYAYIRAQSTNLVWQHTRLGPLSFHSTMRFGKLAGLYLTNALGIMASLGLLIPWAVIRTLKYRADHMEVRLHGALTEFLGSEQEAVAAAGAETMEFFDWDLSI